MLGVVSSSWPLGSGPPSASAHEERPLLCASGHGGRHQIQGGETSCGYGRLAPIPCGCRKVAARLRSRLLDFCCMPTSCDAHGTVPSRNHIDGYGNQPLGSGLGRSPHPAIAGQLTHPALGDPQANGRLAYRDVGDIIGGASEANSNSTGPDSLSVLISWIRNPMTSPSSSSRLRPGLDAETVGNFHVQPGHAHDLLRHAVRAGVPGCMQLQSQVEALVCNGEPVISVLLDCQCPTGLTSRLRLRTTAKSRGCRAGRVSRHTSGGIRP